MDIRITFHLDPQTEDFFRHQLGRIQTQLTNLQTEVLHMASTQADLDAAIAAEDVTVQAIAASVSKIATDVTTLLAKIAAGSTPADLTNEVTAVNSHAASLQAAADILKDADTKANT